MSIPKARVLGLLCSDGHYRNYTVRYDEFDKRRNKYYNRIQNKRLIEFTNTNIALLESFQDLLYVLYKYRPNIIRSYQNVFRVCITKQNVIDDIMQDAVLGNNSWQVPRFVLDGSRNEKLAFLQGFFDGDGSVGFLGGKTPRIRIVSTNLTGLRQVKSLLNSTSISSKLNGPYKRENRRDSYEILLKSSDIKKFIKYVGSNHSKKMKIFELICRADAEIDKNILERVTWYRANLLKTSIKRKPGKLVPARA
jgi:intein/homing endonuclease